MPIRDVEVSYSLGVPRQREMSPSTRYLLTDLAALEINARRHLKITNEMDLKLSSPRRATDLETFRRKNHVKRQRVGQLNMLVAADALQT